MTRFYLKGEDESAARDVDIESADDLASLQLLLAGEYHVVEPSGIGFQASEAVLEDVNQIKTTSSAVGITIDGHGVREPPGPPGLPFVGQVLIEYFEIFPDHLGNHERLFERYGPVFRTTSLGRTVYQVNDPAIALILFTESKFFSKEINENHPLCPIKDPTAGVFLSDTNTEAWRLVHKFMPPALGPKAVRHYTPIMNRCVNGAFKVFDQLEASGDSWNAYQYMVKLASEAVAKVVLGMEFPHFETPDSPLHPMIVAVGQLLALNKKIASKGNLYAKLPFGDPKHLKDIHQWQLDQVEKAIKDHESTGTNDLELQDAALEAANMIDYLLRATDSQGQKLPKDHLIAAVLVASSAGFSTTACLLSWLIYGLVTYPGMQARLLQELVDVGFTDESDVTPELIDKLEFLEKYVKEMQRLHNPSYQPGRTAQTDLILPGGYQMHKGDVMIAAIHHIHNNPEHWDNPAKFDPDRWDTEQVKNRHKAAYCPFAIGQRSCIGFNFALQEVKVFIPKLVWRYEWDRVGDIAVEYDPFFQLIRPINLYVKTTKRTERPSPSDLDKW